MSLKGLKCILVSRGTHRSKLMKHRLTVCPLSVSLSNVHSTAIKLIWWKKDPLSLVRANLLAHKYTTKYTEVPQISEFHFFINITN